MKITNKIRDAIVARENPQYVMVSIDEARALCDLADAFYTYDSTPSYTANCDCFDCSMYRKKITEALGYARSALEKLKADGE